MKRRFSIVAISLLVILLVANIPKLFEPHEPSYRGRTLTSWLDGIDANPDPEDGPEEAAIREIGTNALPILLTWVRSHDSALKTSWVGFVNQQDWLPLHPVFARSRSEYAASAFQVLGSAGAPAVPGLLRLLHDRDPRIRADAAFCLGEVQSGAKLAIPDLGRALTDTDEDVRRQTAWALGNIHEDADEVVPILLHELPENSLGVQYAIVYALAQFGPEARSSLPTLVRLLAAPADKEAADDDLRSTAAYALGEIGEDGPTVVPVLIAALNDPDSNIRFAAVEALGKYGPEAGAAVPLLLRLIAESAGDSTDPDAASLADFRGSAAAALGEIHREAETVIPALIASLMDSDANARMLKAEALGKFGEAARQALPALTKLLQDADPEVRASATNSVLAIDPQAAGKFGVN
jgi:HEAT repeat protein